MGFFYEVEDNEVVLAKEFRMLRIACFRLIISVRNAYKKSILKKLIDKIYCIKKMKE